MEKKHLDRLARRNKESILAKKALLMSDQKTADELTKHLAEFEYKPGMHGLYIDYKTLLEKYMRHLVENEDSTFLWFVTYKDEIFLDNTTKDKVENIFTNEETAILKDMQKDILNKYRPDLLKNEI